MKVVGNVAISGKVIFITLVVQLQNVISGIGNINVIFPDIVIAVPILYKLFTVRYGVIIRVVAVKTDVEILIVAEILFVAAIVDVVIPDILNEPKLLIVATTYGT